MKIAGTLDRSERVLESATDGDAFEWNDAFFLRYYLNTHFSQFQLTLSRCGVTKNTVI